MLMGVFDKQCSAGIEAMVINHRLKNAGIRLAIAHQMRIIVLFKEF